MATILIIEQDQILLKKIKDSLYHAFPSCSTVYHASNYSNALILYREYKPDIVLISSQIELQNCSQTIDSFYQISNPIVLLLIDSLDLHHMKEILTLRNERFIFKPIDWTNFIHIMREVINQVETMALYQKENSVHQTRKVVYDSIISHQMIVNIAENADPDLIKECFHSMELTFKEGFLVIGENKDTSHILMEKCKSLALRQNCFIISSYYYHYEILLVFSSIPIKEAYKKMTDTIQEINTEDTGLFLSPICLHISDLSPSFVSTTLQLTTWLQSQNIADISKFIPTLQMKLYTAIILKYYIMQDDMHAYTYFKNISQTFYILKISEQQRNLLFNKCITHILNAFQIYDVFFENIDLLIHKSNLININDFIISHIQRKRNQSSYVLIRKILSHIQNHSTSSKLTLQTTATALNISPYYICKLLKQYTNLTFSEHVNITRIEIAQSLLKANIQIKFIAMKTGFNSSTYFNRIFKKYMGITPKDFKRYYVDPFK